MTDPGEVWASFSHDPRHPEYAALRAGDQDRNVVHQVLTEAYADGRLDRDEFESLTGEVAAAKTLGELASLVGGLVPMAASLVRPGLGLLTESELQQRAIADWEGDRRDALWGFISASLICWVIWSLTGREFPWPLFVMLGTGLNVGRIQVQRQSMIEAERRRLQKKQRKQLEQRRKEDEEE